MHAEWTERFRWAMSLLGVAIVVTMLGIVLRFAGCSTDSPDPAPTPPPPPPAPATTCADLQIGDVKTEDCAGGVVGKRYSVCQADGALHVLEDQCTGAPPASCGPVTTFADVLPIVERECSRCHPGFTTYAVAKGKIDDFLANVNRTDSLQMPKADAVNGGKKLAPADKVTLEKWKTDGLRAAGDCGTAQQPPPPPARHVSFADFESRLFADGSAVASADQTDTRWLVAVDRINAGDPTALVTYRQAAAKATNSVSTDRQLRQLQDAGDGVYRINLRDLGISAAQWRQIEDATTLPLESFTRTGLALKDLTKARLPWLPVGEFLEAALVNAKVYYSLTKAPATFQQLTRNLGVDFDGDLAAFRTEMLCFNGSALSLAANRLITINRAHGAGGGFFYGTNDTGPIVSDRQSCFKNPLLPQAGGHANLTFAAGEQLYSLANGLMASFLSDAQGRRLDQADPNVVHDFTANPFAPIIKNAVSCFNCHNGGLIHASDQVRSAVAGPGSQVGADDAQRVLALYKPQAELDRTFQADNAGVCRALAEIGVDCARPDPITAVAFRYHGDWTLSDVCARYFLAEDDCRTQLNLSADGKAQVGQLLTGGTVAHDQLVQVDPILRRDFRFGKDPL